MSVVLWGARRGDVQYASRAFWRLNLRIGLPTIDVGAPAYFDVGDAVTVSGVERVLRVDSMEGQRFAVVPYGRGRA